MLRIAALNEELSEESSGVDEPVLPTKEVEEADSLNLYKEALDLRQKNEFDAALKLFHHTLALPCIENALLDEKEEKDNRDIGTLSSCLQIKYACLKNIGALCASKGNFDEALEAYLEAVEVDPLDVTVWHNIGKISMSLKNFQLARHAFLQGLQCSPNHWPCLDGIISVLYGLGDDVLCLHYINIALGKDPFYTRGLIFRDFIFEISPSLKIDLKQIFNEKWIHLFENYPYSEEEKQECLNEAQQLREEVGGLYTEFILPSIPLAKKIESISWIAVGESLLATYRSMSESSDPLKMSCSVQLELSKDKEDIAKVSVDPSTSASSNIIEMMEQGDGLTEHQLTAETSAGKECFRVDEASDKKESPRKISASEETVKSDIETHLDPSLKAEAIKSESRKRKRSVENGISVSEKEIQRRSTRSRAYAQQVEEDIYSLRAELRSFLPTCLLLDENFDATKETKAGDIVNQAVNDHCHVLEDIPISEEQQSVTTFLEKSQKSKSRITDLLEQFCKCVAQLSGFRWTNKLSEVFKDAYQIVRSVFHVSDIFQPEENSNEFALEMLIHAEIFVSSQKNDTSLPIPSWFIEDLMYLFQWADPIDMQSKLSNHFRARVFWLHCNWHFQNGRIEVASNYLQMVNDCFMPNNIEDSQSSIVRPIVTHSIDKPIVLNLSDINEMEEVLVRTMQLEDIIILHQKKKYRQLVSILKATFVIPGSKASNHKYRVPVDRPTQINMLLEGLTALEDFDDYLIWSEKSLDESTNHYLEAYNRKSNEEAIASDQSVGVQAASDWSKVIEKISTEIEEILHFKRTSLNVLNRRALVRFAENLVLICSHQLEAPDASSKMPLGTPIFWVLLHRVIEFEENRVALAKKNVENALQDESIEGVDEALPCSILFLISAHDLLGKHSWCMLDNGVFVLYLLEVLMRKRRVTHDYEDREELGRAIEQASFCALGYPTTKKSKSRSLTDHSVTAVPFTWNRVLLLAEFFLPSRQDLPEFDTVKPTSNAEQEMLLQKVSSLIPPEMDPRNRLEDIQSFIQGQRSDIPKYLNHSCVPSEVENVFYLLGDYYFKNKDWTKAIENYILDLALVPDRFDSWAAVALAIGSRLETKLNSCERLKNLGTFLDRAEAALRCFRRALVLRPLQTTLWIEQGSTAYMLHSFCSQLLRNETDSLSIEMFERLEKEKDRMLNIAHDCFVAADKASLAGMKKGNGDDQDERWLHHYMLGKVAEKRSKPFVELIEHYQRAAKLLEESSATYPKRIPYNTPPHLSVEALEIHYRIHSHCLKTLMSLEGRPQDIAAYFEISKQLQTVSNGAFALGGRKISIEQKEDILEKETKKRKASKHEEEKPTKKTNVETNVEANVDTVPEVKLEGRAATIHDVTIILNEILEKAVGIAKPCNFIMNEDVMIKLPTESAEEEFAAASSPVVSLIDQHKDMDSEPPKPSISELHLNPSSSASSTSDSSSSDSDSESSSTLDSSDEKKEKIEDSEKIVASAHGSEPVPDLQAMVDMCLVAIKECVGRFPHFYKGLYRLAHYFYHSKVNRNIDACRELLFGRPLSASIVQLQQQQGAVQIRYLPTGIAGLFTEWRSNNFFHGVWRIPINEIDRPGCFASHMGRSAALLLDVLRETRDHRLLMELALALQPEPEPDKKYLFDSEREQQASLALSLMVQVLRSRLQEIKDCSNAVSSGIEDLKHSSPQQGSPSSSKKLSLLMDTFRAYDRIERNLPGQETVFGALLIDGFKIYRGPKDHSESDANLMEQALTFCRNKQAQSRARVGGVRGGLASSLGVVSTRGKRAYVTGRRGRPPGASRPTPVRDLLNAGSLPVQTPSSSSSGQNNASVMQEAMKLLQSAGGSINNLPQHLKNIPGISNLLALFSNPTGEKPPAEAPAPAPAPLPAVPVARSTSKKDVPAPKSVAPTLVSSAVSSAPQPIPQTSSMSNPLLQTLASMGGTSVSAASTSASLASLGLMDPALLAMISNPYLNPMSMFGIGGAMGAADASSMSKMQQDYQQQLSNWMQTALAQSYVMSNLTPPYFPSAQRGRGRGIRKSSSNRPSAKMSSTTTESFKPSTSAASEASFGVANPTKASTPDGSSRNKPLDFMRRSDSTEGSKSTGKSNENRVSLTAKFPNDFKLPPPLFESSMMRPPTHQDPGVKHKSVPSAESNKKKSLAPPSSHPTGKPHKRAITTPTVDVSKLIAGFSPAFDMGRIGKSEGKANDNVPSVRGKTPKDLHGAPYSSKQSSKPVGSKDLPVSPFPISLGRDITVTATSASSKPSVSHSSFLSSTSSTGRMKHSQFSQPSSHSSTGYSGMASTSLQFSHVGNSGRPDPHNIAFSVLQNLPSSMSLLVKPNTAPHSKHVSKEQSGPMDLVVNKSSQHSTNQMASLPKLTPAPKLQGSKKANQGNSSQAPPLSFKAVSSASPVPPFLPNLGAPSHSPQIAVPRNPSNQKPTKAKTFEKDSGDDSDVVVLD